MNQQERTLALALSECRTVPNQWDIKFIRSMVWLAKHSPGDTISPPQRYQLQLMAYRYRRQLAGNLDDESLIPVDPPREADYLPPKRPQLQTDLLDGSTRAVEFDEPLVITPATRQKGFF